MGNGEYIENYFESDNEQQLKLRVEKLSDWDKDFQTKENDRNVQDSEIRYGHSRPIVSLRSYNRQ